MIPTTQILVVDDDPMSRWTAAKVLGRRSGIFIPELPSQLYQIRPSDYGLILVDRHMTKVWESAWGWYHSEIVRIGLDVQVVEWTCAADGDETDVRAYAVDAVRKTGHGEELLPVVDRWIQTGRVVKGLMV